MRSFAKWYNTAMELCRIDPEIYPMLLCGFTTISWGSVLMFRKAGQVRLESRLYNPPIEVTK